MSSKKYQSDVVQDGEQWTGRITRQVTSRKSIITKQQEGFASAAEAAAWAELHLAEFVSTQKSANARQGASRKETTEMKRQRSSRRASKTEAAKQEQAEREAAEAQAEGSDTAKPEFESSED